MIILGLDISARKTGWVFYDSTMDRIIETGLIKFPEKYSKTPCLRLSGFYNQLSMLCFENSFDTAIIENPQSRKNVTSLKVLSELIGIAKAVLYQYIRGEIPFVAATTARKTVMGKGMFPKGTAKTEVEKWVNAAIGENNLSEDEKDAYILCKHLSACS